MPVAVLLALSGCSLVTDLSELTRGTSASSGAGGHGAGPDAGQGGGAGGAPVASASSTSASSTSASSGGGASTVVSSSASGSSGAGCSGTGEARDPSSGHCYWNDPNPADILAFSLARSTCMGWAPGADLVVIDDAAEASFVLNKLNVMKDTWVGLSDLAAPGVYTWVDGTALSYTDWDTGYPNDGQGQYKCVSYDASLAWSNAPCSAGRMVLCEQP